jgi:hypothetical protein
VQAALSEREVVPGLIVCVQRSAQWRTCIRTCNVLMTDGGFGATGRS